MKNKNNNVEIEIEIVDSVTENGEKEGENKSSKQIKKEENIIESVQKKNENLDLGKSKGEIIIKDEEENINIKEKDDNNEKRKYRK